MRQTRRFVLRAFVLAALSAVVLPTGLRAQRGPPPRGQGQGQDRQEMEARVREAMAARMKEALGLTDEELMALEERMEPFRESRRALARRESANRLRVTAYLQDGGREGEAEELLNTLGDLRSEELTLFQEELEALADLLNPEQRLQFMVARDQMNQRIRRAREGSGGNRARPPGGGAGNWPETWDGFEPGGIDLPLTLR